jgi:hypothetical protein
MSMSINDWPLLTPQDSRRAGKKAMPAGHSGDLTEGCRALHHQHGSWLECAL